MPYPSTHKLPQEVIQHILDNYYYQDGEIYTKNVLGKSKSTGKPIGWITSKGYKYVDIVKNNKRHRVPVAHIVWYLHYGKFPTLMLDHIDRNKLNNRIENLREANQTEQNFNQAIRNDNTSGYRNISWDSSRSRYSIAVKMGNKRLSKRADSIGEALIIRDKIYKELGICQI